MGSIVSIISTLGSVLTSWFGTKQEVSKATTAAITSAFDLAKQVDNTDAQIAASASAAAVAQFQNEGSFVKIIRAGLLLLISLVVVAWCFGYMPPNVDKPMPPFISECFDIVKFGMGLYYPSRSLEKIARMFVTPKLVGAIVDRVINKK
jgi:hypothetical protein